MHHLETGEKNPFFSFFLNSEAMSTIVSLIFPLCLCDTFAKVDVQRGTVSALFSDAHGWPVVWNNNTHASLRWVLVMVRAHSRHKGPGMSQPEKFQRQ